MVSGSGACSTGLAAQQVLGVGGQRLLNADLSWDLGLLQQQPCLLPIGVQKGVLPMFAAGQELLSGSVNNNWPGCPHPKTL